MQNLSDESNFDEQEDYYDTDGTYSSDRTRSKSDHTPSKDDEGDSDSHSNDSRLWLDMVKHESSASVERCFSSIYYLLAGRGKQPQTNEAVGNVACALIGVHTLDQQTLQVKANADTGGSKNLASKHLLQNVKMTEEYGGKPICMVTVQGDSPAHNHQGCERLERESLTC